MLPKPQQSFLIVDHSGSDLELVFFIRSSENSNRMDKFSRRRIRTIGLEILVEGEFAQNSVTPTSLQNIVVVKNTTGKSKLVLFNGGRDGINSIDYTITTNGVVGAEQHAKVNPPVKTMGASCTASLPLQADNNIGVSEKVITITKVNGKANELKKKSVNCKLTTVDKQVKRKCCCRRKYRNGLWLVSTWLGWNEEIAR